MSTEPRFRRTDAEEWKRPGVTAEMVGRYKAAILAARSGTTS